MAKVTVDPTEFHFVSFDAVTIAKLVGEVADLVGLAPDAEIFVNIDEATPLGRTVLTSVSPITLSIEGGALKTRRRPAR